MIKLVRGRRGVAVLAGAGCALLIAGCGTEVRQAHAEPGRPASAALAPSPTPTGSAKATPAPSGGPERTPGPAEGSLNVLTFRGYVEYGGSDPKVNWLASYQRESGCRVTRLDFARSGEEMARLLEENDYDVVSAPPELAGELIEKKAVAALDPALIPSYTQIPSWLRRLPTVTADGTPYGVPYLWGIHRLAYDSTGKRPGGWADLFRGEGTVMLRDTPLSIADAALALKDVTDPFRLTPDQLEAAVKLLADNRERLAFWDDPKDVVQGFAGGTVRLAQALPYHLDVLRRAGRPVREVSGLRGTGWVDAWLMPAGAEHPNCAYRWLEWAASAETQKQAAGWIGLAPANPQACGGRALRMCEAYRITDRDWLKRIHFAVRPPGDCEAENGECTRYAEWAERWRERVR